jgi:uncharacterized protein (DUF362 family)
MNYIALEANKRPLCAIARNADHKRAVVDVLENLSLPDLTGMRVLLKPNIGRRMPGNTGVNTNPVVTEAVFDFLREKFEAEYFIGDSPITGIKTREAFLASGHGGFLERRDIRFLDLDSRKSARLPLANGRVLSDVKVTGFFPDFDFIVSIPVLKMHMHTGASLGFKNMKGLLYRREKIRFHQLHAPEAKALYGFKELDLAVADLARVVTPHLVVCDATYAQEGMGPSAGNMRQLDTVIASTDCLAADITALAVVKLGIDHVPHLKLIAQDTGGVTAIDQIDTIPADIEPFKTDFAVPPTNIVINKNLMVNLLDEGSCSACQSSVYLFLRNNEALIAEYFGRHGHFNIAIGSDIPEVPADTFVIGNCAACHKERGTFLIGCPPDQTSIMETVRKKLASGA